MLSNFGLQELGLDLSITSLHLFMKLFVVFKSSICIWKNNKNKFLIFLQNILLYKMNNDIKKLTQWLLSCYLSQAIQIFSPQQIFHFHQFWWPTVCHYFKTAVLLIDLGYTLSALLAMRSLCLPYNLSKYINTLIILIQMNKSEYLHLFKVVLVGNSCVGKSSIVIRYADN